MATAGRPPLRRRPDGFAGLAAIIVAQQLSTASAGAIWATAGRGFRSVRAGGHPARPRDAAGTAWAVRAQNPRAEGNRPRRLARRARAGNAGRSSRRCGARGADGRSWHRPVDGRHLSLVMPRSRRCVAGRRPCVAGSGQARLRATGTADRQGDASLGGTLAAVARRGGAGVVDVLPRGGGNKIRRRPNGAVVDAGPKVRALGTKICAGRIGSASQRRLIFMSKPSIYFNSKL